MTFYELREFCQDHRLSLTFRASWNVPDDTVYFIRLEREEVNGWATEREGGNLGDVIDAIYASARRFLEKEVIGD